MGVHQYWSIKCSLRRPQSTRALISITRIESENRERVVHVFIASVLGPRESSALLPWSGDPAVSLVIDMNDLPPEFVSNQARPVLGLWGSPPK